MSIIGPRCLTVKLPNGREVFWNEIPRVQGQTGTSQLRSILSADLPAGNIIVTYKDPANPSRTATAVAKVTTE